MKKKTKAKREKKKAEPWGRCVDSKRWHGDFRWSRVAALAITEEVELCRDRVVALASRKDSVGVVSWC